jgi:hypothetical protein
MLKLNRLAAFLVAGAALALPASALASFSNTGSYEVTGPSSLRITVANNGDPWDRLEVEPVKHTGAEVVAGGPATCGPLTATRFSCAWTEGVFNGKSTKIAVSVQSLPAAGAVLHGRVRYADGALSDPFDITPAGGQAPSDPPPPTGGPQPPSGPQQPSTGGQTTDTRPDAGHATDGQQAGNDAKAADDGAKKDPLAELDEPLVPCTCEDVWMRVTTRHFSYGTREARVGVQWTMDCTGGVGHCGAFVQVAAPAGVHLKNEPRKLLCVGRCGGRTTGRMYLRFTGDKRLGAPGRKRFVVRVLCFGGKVVEIPLVLDVDRDGQIKVATSDLGTVAPEVPPVAKGDSKDDVPGICLCSDVKAGVARRPNGSGAEFSWGHVTGGPRKDYANWFHLRYDMSCTGGLGACAAFVKITPPKGVRMEAPGGMLACALGACGGHSRGVINVRFSTDDEFSDRVALQKFDVQIVCIGGKVIDLPIVIGFDAYGHVDPKRSELGEWVPAPPPAPKK